MRLGQLRIVDEAKHREIPLRVGPGESHVPARAARQRRKALQRIFVAVLGVDRLTGAELDGLSQKLHLLALDAGEMHLDARALAVEEGMVLETLEVKIR